MTNSILSKLIGEVSYRDYKRTQQKVPNALLPYLYNRYMVCTNDKYAYSYVHILSIKSMTTCLERGILSGVQYEVHI